MNAPTRGMYLDHNATTAVSAECLEAMRSCLALGPINPSSKHSLGERARQLLTEAREKVAGAFGSAPAEVVFTSGGTESNHQAILGALALLPQRRHVITTEVEHPSTLMLLRHLQTQGVRVSYLPVDRAGRLIIEALEDVICDDTALVSVMWANNETGVVFPVRRAAELSRSHGALFHTDAVQAVGKLPVDLKDAPVDLLSLSGHKLYAPSGVGALLVRKGIKLPPLLFGHQERGRRGGTENVAAIAALGVACELATMDLHGEATRVQQLRDRLERGILRSVPDATVNGVGAARVCNTSSICFGWVEAEWILSRLDRQGIFASAGAACSSGETKPSHVLTAMGLSAAEALATVRFSLGRHNTERDIDELLQVLPQVLRELTLSDA